MNSKEENHMDNTIPTTESAILEHLVSSGKHTYMDIHCRHYNEAVELLERYTRNTQKANITISGSNYYNTTFEEMQSYGCFQVQIGWAFTLMIYFKECR